MYRSQPNAKKGWDKPCSIRFNLQSRPRLTWHFHQIHDKDQTKTSNSRGSYKGSVRSQYLLPYYVKSYNPELYRIVKIIAHCCLFKLAGSHCSLQCKQKHVDPLIFPQKSGPIFLRIHHQKQETAQAREHQVASTWLNASFLHRSGCWSLAQPHVINNHSP